MRDGGWRRGPICKMAAGGRCVESSPFFSLFHDSSEASRALWFFFLSYLLFSQFVVIKRSALKIPPVVKLQYIQTPFLCRGQIHEID